MSIINNSSIETTYISPSIEIFLRKEIFLKTFNFLLKTFRIADNYDMEQAISITTKGIHRCCRINANQT
jgi:hypothetical protein